MTSRNEREFNHPYAYVSVVVKNSLVIQRYLKGVLVLSGFRPKLLVRVMFLLGFILALHGAFNAINAAPIEIKEPKGLHGGDQFRIIFVTPGTTDALSADISTYDDFVNSQAGGATYNGQVIHWSAIGSTPNVDARDHIGQTSSGVYLADGTLIATSAMRVPGGLWWADPLFAQPIEDLSSNQYTSGFVWTGTCGIGTQYATYVSGYGLVKWGLGSNVNLTVNNIVYDNQIEVGQLGATPQLSGGDYAWISRGFSVGKKLNTNQYQMYGISDVLTVVPEPSTFLISGLGILITGLLKRPNRSPRPASN
jgi:hypothetical protein